MEFKRRGYELSLELRWCWEHRKYVNDKSLIQTSYPVERTVQYNQPFQS